MIEAMKPYSEYKSVDIPWLKRIPAHWQMPRMKHLFSQRNIRGFPDEPMLAATQMKGVVRKDEYENRTVLALKDLHLLKLVEIGDFVISLRSFQGGIEHARHRGIISPAYTILYPNDPTVHGYYASLFKSRPFIDGLGLYVTGIRQGQNIDYTRLSRSCLPLAPLAERKAISAYVNSINRRCAHFIRNRLRLIEVLNEQKQAIINRAVTRGLDPSVPLKPSGIDWLGDIPEHWETRRLRTVAGLRVSNVDKHSKEGEVPVRLCNYTDVYKNTVVTADMPFMAATATRDEIEAFRLHINDVVITKDSENWQDIGVPALVAETADDLVCGYHLAILRPRPNVVVGRFLSYALQCRGVVAQLNLAAKGVTRYGLSHGGIKAVALPVPPVEEQEPIARHIDKATASLGRAISRATREIDLIREYRTRLIADVVTGKVDVRHLAPSPGSADLQEAVDELEPLDDAAGELDEEALAGEVAHADD